MNKKEYGLASFGIGTLSIVFWLSVFGRVRSTRHPLWLVRNGAIATILINTLLGSLLLYSSLRGIQFEILVGWYLFLQIFSGIPFALINGVDSKLTGEIYRAIQTGDREKVSPNAEFRQCRTAGTTAASAIGAFAWSIVILVVPFASKKPACYAIIFGLALLPSAFLLFYLRKLAHEIKRRGLLIRTPTASPRNRTAAAVKYRDEVFDSIKAIGCLEGLLQFSQFYFSLQAIRLLFDKVPQRWVWVIVIPALFYIVNGLEQLGALVFSWYQAYRLNHSVSTIRVRQYAALWTLLVAASFSGIHLFLGFRFKWWVWLDAGAYGIFNVIKGFAGGLSEQWSEVIGRQNPHHDEARFTTLSALFGRGCQITAILCYYALNIVMNRGTSGIGLDSSRESKALVATLTMFVFLFLVANILAYSWISYGAQQYESTWRTLIKAIINPEERTALFTQFLRVIFVASLILSNLLSLKVVKVGMLTFTHGSVFYVMLFVLINLISIFESAQAAIKTVILGVSSYVFVYFALLISAIVRGTLTVSDKLITVPNYDYLLFRAIGWLFFASFVGYIATLPLDVWLVSLLKKYFAKLSPLGMAAAVTFVCQLVDTVIFVKLGFFTGRGRLENVTQLGFTSMLFGQFAVKFCVYLVMYFPLYLIIQFCSKWLGVKPPRTRRQEAGV